MAFDLQNSDTKIIDIGLKYGYDLPDVVACTFKAIHGLPPSKPRDKGVSLKAYPEMTFSSSIKGVVEMNYRIEEKDGFTIVGVKTTVSYVKFLLTFPCHCLSSIRTYILYHQLFQFLYQTQ